MRVLLLLLSIGVLCLIQLVRCDDECSGADGKCDAAGGSDALCDATQGGPKELPLGKDTVHFGYYDKSMTPSLRVLSGDEVSVDLVAPHACDDYDKLIGDDAALQGIFNVTSGVPPSMRVGHDIMSGPIEICGSQPGDIIKVEVLSLAPRVKGRKGYGVQRLSADGYHQYVSEISSDAPAADKKEHLAVWDLHERWGEWSANLAYYMNLPTLEGPDGKEASYPGTCIPHTYKGFKHTPDSLGYTSRDHLHYTVSLRPLKVKLSPHIGNMGVASARRGKITADIPRPGGGHLGQRRLGVGMTMYYQVEVKGGLLSLGAPHAVQGDGQLGGTGLETNLRAKLRVSLLKKKDLPVWLSGLSYPLGETSSDYVLHAFTRKDPMAAADINKVSNFDDAMANIVMTTRDFLMDRYGVTEPEVPDIISLAIGFGVTQATHGNWGAYATVPKAIFPPYEGLIPYHIKHKEPYAGSRPIATASGAKAVEETACPSVKKGYKQAPVSLANVHWGYWSDALPPIMHIKSGDVLRVETAGVLSGLDWDHLCRGDSPMEAIFGRKGDGSFPLVHEGRQDPAILGHVMTGPFYVCDADPGDILQVDLVDLRPRKNPQGEMYGRSDSVGMGYHRRLPMRDGTPFTQDYGSLWQIHTDGKEGYWSEPVHFYPYQPITTPANDTIAGFDFVNVPHTYEGESGDVRSWGWRTEKPYEYRTHSQQMRVPLFPHFGCLGVASSVYPEGDNRISTIPPIGQVGSNVDERLFTRDTSLFFRVEVPGALFSVGDGHCVQGVGELDGTGLECSLDGTLRFNLIKQGSRGYDGGFATLEAPMAESKEYYLITGLSIDNFLTYFAQHGQGKDPVGALAKLTDHRAGVSDGALDGGRAVKGRSGAMRNTYINAKKFLMGKYGLSEVEAVIALSVGADLGISQVVDTNHGMHYKISKFMLSDLKTKSAAEAETKLKEEL
ncbi:unnamed protein product [Vitrella brassicaformis CCMP3155]|uniref:Acetamidase n=1 Tax=Vitrella brassicaformis (strain CCMP3155) TaxID=1169540 RepID=A0A0G4H8G3_VITBC|nr:unnamed protein product [Vitrella brassicaformis CCMP3155]|eukprot:CEM40053.1 unnamed protein product [Vitrella brassicaformis CCMP3155]